MPRPRKGGGGGLYRRRKEPLRELVRTAETAVDSKKRVQHSKAGEKLKKIKVLNLEGDDEEESMETAESAEVAEEKGGVVTKVSGESDGMGLSYTIPFTTINKEAFDFDVESVGFPAFAGSVRTVVDGVALEKGGERERKDVFVGAKEGMELEMDVPVRDEVRVVDFEELCKWDVVGAGTFAEVRCGLMKDTPVAIKMFNGKCPVESLAREVAVLSAFNHPNIVKFEGVAWQKIPVDEEKAPEDEETKDGAETPMFSYKPVLVMEFCTKGSLFQLMYQKQELKQMRSAAKSLPEYVKYTKSIIRGIVCGLEHMHLKGIVHFDLCSANILMTNGFQPKVADFGQSRRSFGVGAASVGHAQYRAPELCVNPSHNYYRSVHWTDKVDVYAFGILLWEILHREFPWRPSDDIPKRVRNGDRPSINHDLAPQDWADLISACWDATPENRPTMTQILQHVESLPLRGRDLIFEDKD